MTAVRTFIAIFVANFVEKSNEFAKDFDKVSDEDWDCSHTENCCESTERERSLAQKRGGGTETISFDAQPEEERYLIEPTHVATPERLFERRWAHTVLERAVAELKNELTEAGHAKRFEVLKGFLSESNAGPSYADAAGQLGLSVAAVTSIIHRMRQRYLELFRDEIAQTVANPAEVEDEIRHLIEVLTP